MRGDSMKMRFKIIVLLFGVLLIFSSCAEKERYVYTEEDKQGSTYSMAASRWFAPSLEANVWCSDLIVQGTIISDPETVTTELSPGVPYTVTEYRLRVGKTWFGETDEKTIRFRIMGTYPVYHRADEVVVYLNGFDDADYYMLVDNEHSVYIANPPTDMAFTLSENSDIAAYEGMSLEDIRQQTEAILQDIQQNGASFAEGFSFLVGDVVIPYYETYLSSVEGDITE